MTTATEWMTQSRQLATRITGITELQPMRIVSHGDHKLFPKVLVATVGPPARGKSFLSKSFEGHTQKVFNAGNIRRREEPKLNRKTDAAFFESSEGIKLLNEWAMQALREAIDWLKQQPEESESVAILDATNTTTQRRIEIFDMWSKVKDDDGLVADLLFIESMCPNPLIVHYNLLNKVLTSPDYKSKITERVNQGVELENSIAISLEDAKKRDLAYLRRYEPITKSEKEKMKYVSFMIPSCTFPASAGLIETNLSPECGLLKALSGIPPEVFKKLPIENYSSYASPASSGRAETRLLCRNLLSMRAVQSSE